MNSNVKRDMGISSRLFQTHVWPAVKGILQGGELLLMEGRPDHELATKLDTLSGIDGWQAHKDFGIRGIASRIQPCGKNWASFTVRKRRFNGATTEYEKRVAAIHGKGGWLYPHLTIQAYAKSKDGPLLAVGIARTSDLIGFIQAGQDVATQQTGNAEFYVCYWDAMKKQGYHVHVIDTPALANSA